MCSTIAATLDADLLAERSARSAMCDPWVFAALGRQLIADDLVSLAPRLGELAVPVTVLVGSLDEPLAGFAPDIAGAIRHATLVVIDGAYHSPQLTHPAGWRAAIEAHLEHAG